MNKRLSSWLSRAGVAVVSNVMAHAKIVTGRFVSDRRGNIAVTLALALIPIVTLAGGAIDVSRAYVVKARLTQALDAAGLAVAGTPGASETKLKELAQHFFNANYPAAEIGVPGNLLVALGDNTVTLSVTADMQTVLLGIVGIDEMQVGAEIEVTRESKGLEVVMVLDNTGSMGSSGKIQALKTASRSMIDILFGDQAHPEKLMMGLVPFAAGVNVGTDFSEDYMDMAGQSSIHDENFTPGTNLWSLYNDIRNRSWPGCVQTRPSPMDEEDTLPTRSNPDSLWVPWFAPDEPDKSNYYYVNDYLSDDTRNKAKEDERQRNTSKYNNAWVSSSSKGPNDGCDMRPITPMTNDRNLLLDEIDAMQASGLTHIPVGLAWGWRVISPSAPFTEGKPYDDKEVNKAIILLTDGENVLGTRNNHNGSYYTAYGYLSEGRLGTTNGWTASNRLDEKTEQICENIKDTGVRLYTITFQVSSSSTRELMRDCATSPSLYFDSPSNEELTTVFQAIARDLSNLRLSR